MKTFKYPKLRQNVYLFEKTNESAFLYDVGQATRFEIDEKLLSIVSHLDGVTNPNSIANCTEEDIQEALHELDSYGLLEHNENRVQGLFRILRHPNMLGVIALAIMVDTWFTHQETTFLLAAMFLLLFLICYAILDKN